MVSMMTLANQAVEPEPNQCAIHFFPADRIRSVGEDFDAVHALDQDLRSYYNAAGRDLAWLTPAHQLSIVTALHLDRRFSSSIQPILHDTPIERSQAVSNGPRVAATDGCQIEVRIPQIFMERGGLATRSLRIFGAIKHYAHGQLIASYSGFASAEMQNFRLKAPADSETATKIVEGAYSEAVGQLVDQSKVHFKQSLNH